MSQPWDIWWDFQWEGTDLKWIVIQTNHPSYRDLDYLHRLPVSECANKDGHIDDWVDGWFQEFRDDLLSGRMSLHEYVKSVKKSL